MTMMIMMLITMTMTVPQPITIAHTTSKQTQPTTNKETTLAGAHHKNFPGKQLAVEGQKEPEVEQDMYMHSHRLVCKQY